MFCSFQIHINEIISLFDALDRIKQILYLREYKKFSDVVNAVLKDLNSAEILSDKLSKGSRLQDMSFPSDIISSNFDVFISHAHADEEHRGTITKLAAYLYGRYGIRCFIDSEFWAYGNDIIKKINKAVGKHHKYKLDGGKTLNTSDTDDLLYISSNIHAMLSMALMRMIDNIPCTIFVDSEESIKFRFDKYGKIREITKSPWLYEEINYVNSITRKQPDYYKQTLEEVQNCYSDTFGFDVDKGNFKKLNSTILENLEVGKREVSMCLLFDRYFELNFPSNNMLFS